VSFNPENIEEVSRSLMKPMSWNDRKEVVCLLKEVSPELLLKPATKGQWVCNNIKEGNPTIANSSGP